MFFEDLTMLVSCMPQPPRERHKVLLELVAVAKLPLDPEECAEHSSFSAIISLSPGDYENTKNKRADFAQVGLHLHRKAAGTLFTRFETNTRLYAQLSDCSHSSPAHLPSASKHRWSW
jgi:hypothetical protein